jgi:bifunctional NMN adenylyltransferase/nudix hydrolase
MKKYKLAVFIGRFQPYHNGHHAVVTKGLEVAEYVLILIGSSGGARSLRNPFTWEERCRMIQPHFNNRVMIDFLPDYLYNDERWIESIQQIVAEHADDNEGIVLIGHTKDGSSYYLKLFPQWHHVDVPNLVNLSSTDIREAYFGWGGMDEKIMPKPTLDFLLKFQETPEYSKLVAEQVFVDNYKSKWANSPYPPTFVTVDACVVQSGHILLVKRKEFPGKGLWALPGGFINQMEKIEDAVIRELREETKIKVPAPVLRGCIKDRKVFDDPYRSSRGRTITHAFLIVLPPDFTLPKVKGSDDAEKASWFPISQVTRDMMYEDHMDIIQNLTATI